MRIRHQLAILLGAALALCLMSVAGFAYLHNYDMELGEVDTTDHTYEEAKKVALYFSPLAAGILIFTFWWLRRLNRRYMAIMEATEKLDLKHLSAEVPDDKNARDELHDLAVVLENLRRRLYTSWDQIQAFTMQASHELKTPIAIIRADMEMALRESAAGKPISEDWMHSVLDELDRLTGILNQLDTLSKADAGKLQIELKPVDLAPLMQAAWEDAEILLHDHKLGLLPGKFPPAIVNADAGRIRQLLLNLISNAIKHNLPNGWMQMELNLSTENSAVIIFRNSSERIPPEEIMRVFDRFFRTDSTQRRKLEGSGLGLALVSWIVDQHQGSVTFENRQRGVDWMSEIKVTLPLATSP